MDGPPYRDYLPEDERSLPAEVAQHLQRGEVAQQAPREGHGALRVLHDEPGRWWASWQDGSREQGIDGDEDVVRAWVLACPAPVERVFVPGQDEYVPFSELAWARAREEGGRPRRARSTLCCTGEQPRAGRGTLHVEAADDGRWIATWQDGDRRVSLQAAPEQVRTWAEAQPAAVRTTHPS